jgi:hypothetical protein
MWLFLFALLSLLGGPPAPIIGSALCSWRVARYGCQFSLLDSGSCVCLLVLCAAALEGICFVLGLLLSADVGCSFFCSTLRLFWPGLLLLPSLLAWCFCRMSVRLGGFGCFASSCFSWSSLYLSLVMCCCCRVLLSSLFCVFSRVVIFDGGDHGDSGVESFHLKSLLVTRVMCVVRICLA